MCMCGIGTPFEFESVCACASGGPDNGPNTTPHTAITQTARQTWPSLKYRRSVGGMFVTSAPGSERSEWSVDPDSSASRRCVDVASAADHGERLHVVEVRTDLRPRRTVVAGLENYGRR